MALHFSFALPKNFFVLANDKGETRLGCAGNVVFVFVLGSVCAVAPPTVANACALCQAAKGSHRSNVRSCNGSHRSTKVQSTSKPLRLNNANYGVSSNRTRSFS